MGRNGVTAIDVQIKNIVVVVVVVAASLSVLTGLQWLDLGSTGLCLLMLWGWSWDCVREGVLWVFVFRVCACAAFLFVMRVAVNELGPEGGQCVAASLSVLTGLQTLVLHGTGLCLLLMWGWFWDCVREGVFGSLF